VPPEGAADKSEQYAVVNFWNPSGWVVGIIGIAWGAISVGGNKLINSEFKKYNEVMA
jgi:hypothetical protein